jgi:hypothetical protein
MLKYIRQRLFGASGFEGREALQAWCESLGWTMRGIREQEGFVIDTRAGELEGRIEWGPSQRRYLGGHELRLRGELPMDPQMHALVMPRPLMQTVENELFSQIVGRVQTRIDEDTPEEMRWLAISPRLGPGLLGELKAHYAGAGSHLAWLSHWLRGPLGDLLLQRATGPSELAAPFALIAHRGRLTLRVALPQPQVASVQASMALFEVALAQARLAVQAAAEVDVDLDIDLDDAPDSRPA